MEWCEGAAEKKLFSLLRSDLKWKVFNVKMSMGRITWDYNKGAEDKVDGLLKSFQILHGMKVEDIIKFSKLRCSKFDFGKYLWCWKCAG